MDRFAPIPCPLPDRRAPNAIVHVLAPAQAPLEPARAQPCYEGMDDTADHAVALLEAAPLSLTTPELLAEIDALSMRIVRRETRARDMLLVLAISARLRTALLLPARNREPLEGMLWLPELSA